MVRITGWVGKMVGGDLCHPLEMGAERKGRPQQVICYRPGGETRRLDLKEGREM